MSRAKDVVTAMIRSEHRSLAAVIHAMKTLAQDARSGTQEPDFALLWKMLYYVEAYPDAVHHPNEDQYLFARMRERSPPAASLLDELHQQHHDGEAKLDNIRIALGHREAGVTGAADALGDAVDRFAEFYWRHMATEERDLLPLAEVTLSDSDWEWVAAGFEGNRDPLQKSAPAASGNCSRRSFSAHLRRWDLAHHDDWCLASTSNGAGTNCRRLHATCDAQRRFWRCVSRCSRSMGNDFHDETSSCRRDERVRTAGGAYLRFGCAHGPGAGRSAN